MDKNEVIFRKTTPVEDKKSRFAGFKQEVVTLKKGCVYKKGYMPLPCDIIFERDVPVKMRDGITIYTDIFRPVTNEKVPAIIAWSPYGKNGTGCQNIDTFPGKLGIDLQTISGLMKFEGPDPAYWCNQGYAVCHPDSRGAFMSEGNIHFWGTQDKEDGYDYIEWVAKQEWCSEKIGMSGNSWLAISQWGIAELKPPHLTAIAPWEGATDTYRDDCGRGGFDNTIFNESILEGLYGNTYIEDTPAMMKKYPFFNEYWADKVPDLTKIDVPAYIVASYSNIAHVHGSFQAFQEISSKEKWLRVHNELEWTDYYKENSVRDLQRFFDYYLKGIDTGWKNTPKVRLSVLDMGGTDIINRAEEQFPLERTQYQKLYLDNKTHQLVNYKPEKASNIRYNSETKDGKAVYRITFNKDTEITGYCKVKLWVAAEQAEDMDIFVFLYKLDKNGKRVIHKTVRPKNFLLRKVYGFIKAAGMCYPGPNGRLRVSMRHIDIEKSTEYEPYHTFDRKEPLAPGEKVCVEIPFWPTGMLFHTGETLELVISGQYQNTAPLPGMDIVKGENKGKHLIYAGGKFDSYLQIPIIMN